MFLILIVVTLENFLANTFYKEAPQAQDRRRGLVEPIRAARAGRGSVVRRLR